MIVRRVQNPTGDHIEPPLDETWDDLTKLHWQAAVVAHDTGLTVHVGDGALRVAGGAPIPGWYTLSVGHTSTSPLTFGTAWAYLNGVSVGAQETARPQPGESQLS